MPLALINIARARFQINDPHMADFVNNIARINLAAERSPGFIWRLIENPEDTPKAISVFGDPQIVINMAVWESIEALEDYTYKTVHRHIVARRNEWFVRLDSPHMALWWVEEGHVPTVEDGKRRLELLQQNGPSVEAFTFKSPHPAPAATR